MNEWQPEQGPKDVRAAIVAIGLCVPDPFLPQEAPTSVECPHPSQPPPKPQHFHDDLLMGERALCGSCHPPEPNHDPAIARALNHAFRNVDPGNPKDSIGSAKAPITTWPMTVIAEGGVAMLEGALKYGRHNYRAAPVKASVYIDAAVNRHLAPWFDGGEDIDPDSGISHLTKAIVGLAILRDAMICGKMIDDRPPPSPPGFFRRLNDKAAELVAKYPNPVPPYTAHDTEPAPALEPQPLTTGESVSTPYDPGTVKRSAPMHGKDLCVVSTQYGDVMLPPSVCTRDPVEVELDALKARTLPRYSRETPDPVRGTKTGTIR